MTDEGPSPPPAAPTPSAPPAPPTLQYGPQERRLRTSRLIIGCLLFLLALWGASKWRSIARLYATTQAYVWQRRAMAHRLPPDTIVYSEDPATIDKLLADPRYYRATQNGPAMYDPPALRQMEQWRQEPGTVSHGRGPYGALFLHARTAPGESERLVAVSVLPFGASGINGPRAMNFFVATVTPGTLTRFWELDRPRLNGFSLLLNATDQLTAFAGQADPSDPSHFTIRCTLNDRPGTIDGWLRPAGVVELRPREGTVAPSPTMPAMIWDPNAAPATAPATKPIFR